MYCYELQQNINIYLHFVTHAQIDAQPSMPMRYHIQRHEHGPRGAGHAGARLLRCDESLQAAALDLILADDLEG